MELYKFRVECRWVGTEETPNQIGFCPVAPNAMLAVSPLSGPLRWFSPIPTLDPSETRSSPLTRAFRRLQTD